MLLAAAAARPPKILPFSFTSVARKGNQTFVQTSDDSVMAMPEVSNSTLTTATSEPEDEIFLEGPRSRLAEFFTLLRVMRDFLRGFRTLHFVGDRLWLGEN